MSLWTSNITMIMFDEIRLSLSNTIPLFCENKVIFERYGKDVSDLRTFIENQSNIFMSNGTMSLNWIAFCGMVDRRKEFSLISSRDHCQRSSPSRISDTSQAGFELAQNLSSSFVEWSCTLVITTTSRGNSFFNLFNAESIGTVR